MNNDFEIIERDDEFFKKIIPHQKRFRKAKKVVYRDRSDKLKFAIENDLIKDNGGYLSLTIYEDKLDEMMKKQSLKKKDDVSSDIKVKPYEYHYNVDKLFDKDRSVIRYDLLEAEWMYYNRITKEYTEKPHTCLFLSLWLKKYIEYNNYIIQKKKIVYNERHYAVRNDRLVENSGRILLTSDFIRYNGKEVIRYKKGFFSDEEEKQHRVGVNDKIMKDIYWTYISLFYFIGITENDDLFIHVLWLMNKTVDLNSWLFEKDEERTNNKHDYFSPITLKNYIELFKQSNKQRTELFKDTSRHRFQHLFLEPGYEEIGRKNFLEDRRKAEVKAIYKAIDIINERNEELNNVNVYNEVSARVKIAYRKFRQLVLENNINIGKVYKVEFKTIVEEKDVEHWDGTIEHLTYTYTKMVKAERKKQDRSEWHQMVIEGKSFEEVSRVYPNVKASAYRMFKSRLNRK